MLRLFLTNRLLGKAYRSTFVLTTEGISGLHCLRVTTLDPRGQATLAYTQSGKPWQKRFAECVVGNYRREVLNAEILMSPAEGQTISIVWLHLYNTERPHRRHNYRPPITAFNSHAA